MDTEPAWLTYQEIQEAIDDFDEIIPWVRDADLTFDLNYSRSMHEEVKEQIEEARQEITEKYRTYLDDDEEKPLLRAPDGRLVAQVEGTFYYVREVEGDAVTEGTELRPTGAEYIKDEDRDEIVQTPLGGMTKAQKKQRELDINATDQEAYNEELADLNERRFRVPYVPVDPGKLRDDDNVDSSRSVNFSNIMHIFMGVDTKANEPPEEGDGKGMEEPAENGQTEEEVADA